MNIDPLVARINLEPIMVKAMKEDGLSLAEAEVATRELQRFYTLHRLFPNEPLSPSKPMDAMWHLHILDTMKYSEDCDVMFGHFLHHFPYLGLRGKEDEQELVATFDRTRELYRQTFGGDMPGGASMTVCGGGCNLDQDPPKPGGPKPKAALCGIKTASLCNIPECRDNHCVSPNDTPGKGGGCISPNSPMTQAGPKKPKPGCSSCRDTVGIRPTLAEYLAQQI